MRIGTIICEGCRGLFRVPDVRKTRCINCELGRMVDRVRAIKAGFERCRVRPFGLFRCIKKDGE